jgi:hypothetical protein
MNGNDNGDFEALKIQVSYLSNTIYEVKEILRKLGDTITLIHIMEVQSSQHTTDINKLAELLRTIVTRSESTHKDLEKSVDQVKEELDQVKEDLEKQIGESYSKLNTKVDEEKGTWKDRYNVARGVWLGLTFAVFLFGGILVYFVRSNVSDIQDDHDLLFRLRVLGIEEFLKGKKE